MFILMPLFFSLLCYLPSADLRQLRSKRKKKICEKLTRTLDKVPPAGPGCQAGRILVDSTISHGNEHKADIHALNYTTLRPQHQQTTASAISSATLSLSQSQAVKF